MAGDIPPFIGKLFGAHLQAKAEALSSMLRKEQAIFSAAFACASQCNMAWLVGKPRHKKHGKTFKTGVHLWLVEKYLAKGCKMLEVFS